MTSNLIDSDKTTLKNSNAALASSKELITNLILQDLRHHQLIAGLHQARLYVDVHDLDIMEIVAQLMGISCERLSDQWSEMYFRFMDRAAEYEVTNRGKALEPLAEECYRFMAALTDIENGASRQ